MMILLDALYVNEGGAKVLLDYLVKDIEKNKLDVFYLFDDRCKDSYHEISIERKIYLKPSFFQRYKFYKKNESSISKVLCFGNLPPNIRLKATVYTYFHNLIYLDIPKEFSLKEQMKFKLKIKILKLIAKNTNYWIVQSSLVRQKLHQKFHFDIESILQLPFYPQYSVVDMSVRKRLTYIYVSNGTPHKNHIRLINIFCKFFNQYKKGKLILTINEDYPDLLKIINEKENSGYPIHNIGFVDRNCLQEWYLKTDFLIFPSLTESFGLGLIEAIECGCKVIGADLAYTYEVCEPSIVFNPLDDKSFFEAFEKSLNTDIKMSIPKIKNNINELINIFQEKSCN